MQKNQRFFLFYIVSVICVWSTLTEYMELEAIAAQITAALNCWVYEKNCMLNDFHYR